MTSPRRSIKFLMTANSLQDVERTGYVMSGIEHPEDVAAHSFGVAAAALLIADRVAEPVDRGRLLTMAVLHDIGEAVTGDVALIVKTPEDDKREATAVREILTGMPECYIAAHEEYEGRKCIEARIVKAADKLQMMARILAYESEGRGDLGAFWDNARNFKDWELPEAAELFAEIRRIHDDREVTAP
jgi:putative hydrolase of HD superfamily